MYNPKNDRLTRAMDHTAKSRFRLIIRGLTAFVTLVVAVATLLTAVVAYRNEQDTREQVQLLKRQVDFNSAETRPFLRLKPSLPPGKPFRVDLEGFEVGQIPARLIAYDMLVQVGHRVLPPKGGTINTPDILYPNQPAGGIFLPFTHRQLLPFLEGSEPLIVGGCVVYGPISGKDPRRWMASVVYRFDSPTGLPLALLADEVAVPPRTNACDASKLRDQWLSQLKIHPAPLSHLNDH